MQQTNFTEHLRDNLSFDMIWVEGGNFLMGNREEDAMDRELPVHKVEVLGFFIGKYPVTQVLYEAITGGNPSQFKGPNHPVEMVSWNDVKAFMGKLNQNLGKSYRLLTEAEWEYAARGGIYSEDYLYSGSDNLKEVGWYTGNNSPKGTKPIGEKLPNELGIFGMSGNVYEWCEDDYHDSYKEAPNEGSAWINHPIRREHRVLRGGDWDSSAHSCRVSDRGGYLPGIRVNDTGFRLALSPI